MKTIGLIGGLSWESTVVYYQRINRTVRAHLGGLHSAKILLYSCDFAEMAALMQEEDWEELTQRLCHAARTLERAGADCVAICTNTMHKVAGKVAASVSIPLIDIRSATGAAIKADGIGKVCLLGTLYTMEHSFFRDALQEESGLDVVVPDAQARARIHAIIFEELCQGVVCPESHRQMCQIIADQAQYGVEAVILGCTELMLSIKQGDSVVPLFDTTILHAAALAEFALQE